MKLRKTQGCAGSALLLLVSGCAGLDRAGAGHAAPRPAAISHVVLVKLKDPGDARALIAHCDANLPAIPSVVSYACGRHVDTGRPGIDAGIDAGYDVGIYVGFASRDGYAAYVDHPLHVDVTDTWKSRLEWIRIHDVLDETP